MCVSFNQLPDVDRIVNATRLKPASMEDVHHHVNAASMLSVMFSTINPTASACKDTPETHPWDAEDQRIHVFPTLVESTQCVKSTMVIQYASALKV